MGFWYSRLNGDRKVILSKVRSSDRPAPAMAHWYGESGRTLAAMAA